MNEGVSVVGSGEAVQAIVQPEDGSTQPAAKYSPLILREEVDGLIARDEGTWKNVVGRAYKSLYDLGLYVTGSSEDAGAVASSTLEILVGHCDKIHQSPTGFLIRVAGNEARDVLRKNKRRREQSLDQLMKPDESNQFAPFDPPDTALPIEQQIIENEERIHLQRALAQIPEDKRSVLIMWANGIAQNEIALKHGISVGTVKSRISRAQVALRAAYLSLDKDDQSQPEEDIKLRDIADFLPDFYGTVRELLSPSEYYLFQLVTKGEGFDVIAAEMQMDRGKTEKMVNIIRKTLEENILFLYGFRAQPARRERENGGQSVVIFGQYYTFEGSYDGETGEIERSVHFGDNFSGAERYWMQKHKRSAIKKRGDKNYVRQSDIDTMRIMMQGEKLPINSLPSNAQNIRQSGDIFDQTAVVPVNPI